MYGGLRVSQAAHLRGGDVLAAGGVYLTLRQDKRMKCGSTREVVSVREVVHPAAREIIDGSARGASRGTHLCDGGPRFQYHQRPSHPIIHLPIPSYTFPYHHTPSHTIINLPIPSYTFPYNH